jgi:hypothetical protein
VSGRKKAMFDKSAMLAKGAVAALAAGALTFVSASPALADDHRERRGPSAGEVIAGVAVVGGIAALAGAFNRDQGRQVWRGDDRRDANWRGRDNWGGGWQGNGFGRGDRGLVERCARAAEIEARRRGGWRNAQVTEIRNVDRTRDGGFRVRGALEVQGSPGFAGRNFDRGRFNCFTDGRGRPFIEFGGIRGLR